jgi:hypothetical protein
MSSLGLTTADIAELRVAVWLNKGSAEGSVFLKERRAIRRLAFSSATPTTHECCHDHPRGRLLRKALVWASEPLREA